MRPERGNVPSPVPATHPVALDVLVVVLVRAEQVRPVRAVVESPEAAALARAEQPPVGDAVGAEHVVGEGEDGEGAEGATGNSAGELLVAGHGGRGDRDRFLGGGDVSDEDRRERRVSG